MSVHQVLAEAEPERIEAFMQLAEDSLDERDLLLLQAIIREGKSAWSAAASVAELVNQSPHTLYLRARDLIDEVHMHFGISARAWAERLLRDRVAYGVPPHQVGDVTRRCAAVGIELTQEITLRIKEAETSDPET